MPIAQGGGSNGKTTITGAVLAAMGDHATQLSQRTLGGRDGDHPTELMALRGARFALSEELPDGATLNLKRLKDALGAKRMRARYMRQDEVEWVSSHTLMMTSNYRPRVTETDDGTWRRLALLVFPLRYRKPHEATQTPYDRPADLSLRPRLLAGDDDRASAVLAWLVEGARRWYAEGEAPMPPSVAADTDAWRREADEIRSFLTDTVEFDPNARALSSDLYLAYAEWAANHGRRVRDDADFTSVLESHSLTLQHRLTKKRTAALEGISRWPGHGAVTPPIGAARARVWQGLRFLEAAP